jgi:hypothetical protein
MRPLGITVNYVFNSSAVLFVSSFMCGMTRPHTKKLAFPEGHLDVLTTCCSHNFILFSFFHPSFSMDMEKKILTEFHIWASPYF